MDLIQDAENEEQRKGRNKQTQVNRTYINSGEYRKKFDLISNSSELNRLLYRLSKQMLLHRTGTKYEDMYWIDIDEIKVVASELESTVEESITYSETTRNFVRKLIETDLNILTIHTHPNSFPPSINDIISNFVNGYQIGIVICHDGTIYMYSANEEIDPDYYHLLVAKHLKSGYNEKKAQKYALEELRRKFQFAFKEVLDDDHGK